MMNCESFKPISWIITTWGTRWQVLAGVKKIRWSRPGSGKSGGVRVIYYVRAQSGRIYLIVMYPKNVQDNLTDKQKALIKAAVQKLT